MHYIMNLEAKIRSYWAIQDQNWIQSHPVLSVPCRHQICIDLHCGWIAATFTYSLRGCWRSRHVCAAETLRWWCRIYKPLGILSTCHEPMEGTILFDYANIRQLRKAEVRALRATGTAWCGQHNGFTILVAWRQLNVILISCDGLGQLRLSCINMCYHDDDARYQILELLAWSLEAMGSSAQCLKTTSANLYWNHQRYKPYKYNPL